MDRLNIATVVKLGLVLASSLCRGGADIINCDSVYFAELGKPYIIACNVTSDQYYVYWFKGVDTRTFPILSFDDEGEKSPHKEYSFTENKSLNITNTELKHEGKYTLRIYFNEFDFNTTTTELQVFIRPDPPCPLIDACGSTCTGCQLNVTTSGSLTCYVSGSRPIMDVDWIVTNQSGLSYTKEEQTQKEMGDRWYTEKNIQYTTSDCGADATFRCIASLSDFPLTLLLGSYYSTVRINTEACKEPPSMEPTSGPKGRAWPFFVIGIIIAFVAIFVLIACFWCRKNGTSTHMVADPLMEMQTTNTEPNPKPRKRSLEERKTTLVEGLMQHYEKFGFIKPLPWGEPIPIHALYTPCQCTVTNVNGDVSHQTTDFLFTPEYNFDSTNRVIIIADLGYGKTTYTQHLVSDWVSKMKTPKVGKKNQTSEPILIYIHLKEVVPSMILSKLVKKMMPVGIDLKVDDIVEIFLNFEFQVLLDGLDELSMSTISAKTSPENPPNAKEERVNLLQEGGENDANLTVANLIENKINTFKFKNIKVWVTSREFDEMDASFTLPYSKVKLNGFSSTQVNEYIQKTCKYYLNSQAKPPLSLILDSNMKGSKSQAKADPQKQETIEERTANNDIPPVTEGGCNNEVTAKLIKPGKSEQKNNTCDTVEILSKKVYECMELNEIFQNFSKTPLLLIMIIHIIACRMLDPTGKYKEMNVNKLTTIIRLVITCLESRYVQKVDSQSIEKDIKSLENTLCKIAFENKMSLSLSKRDDWNSKLCEEDTQLALAVGLLKYSKKVGSGGSQLEELAFSSYAGIMFYHEFFQEFLAAKYVPQSDKEWEWIFAFIKKSTDDSTVRLLQFMFGMNHARLDKAIQYLVKEQKMWNNLIDCMYEINNLEKKRTIIKDMSKATGIFGRAQSRVTGFFGKDTRNLRGLLGKDTTIHIQHLDRKHHRVALTDFCDACNYCHVKLESMTFREECAIDFIKDVTLPSLKTLIFLEMNINKDQFASIITSLTDQEYPEILQFEKCSISKEVKEEAKKTESLKMKTKNCSVQFRNCETKSPATMSRSNINLEKGEG